VALGTLETFGALIPANALSQHLAVFGRVFEYLGWAAEVPHVVRVDAALAVVAVLLGWAPGRLVHEHVEDEAVLVQVETLQVEVQVGTHQETLWHEVILDTFVLEVQVNLSNLPKIPESET